MDYILKRSRRKTLSVEIGRDATIVVRAPSRLPQREIDRFLEARQGWIEAHLEERRRYHAENPPPGPAELEALRAQAWEVIPGRVAQFAALMGVTPAAVKITLARTRFGSCSGKNSLCFSCLLMRYPSEAVDYVVVHELAHILHKNHGKEFYAVLGAVLPDYKARKALLRK